MKYKLRFLVELAIAIGIIAGFSPLAAEIPGCSEMSAPGPLGGRNCSQCGDVSDKCESGSCISGWSGGFPIDCIRKGGVSRWQSATTTCGIVAVEKLKENRKENILV